MYVWGPGVSLWLSLLFCFLLTLVLILIVNQERPSVRCNTDLNRIWLFLLFKSHCSYKASANLGPFSPKAFGSETSPDVLFVMWILTVLPNYVT